MLGAMSGRASMSSKLRIYIHTSPASFLIGAITWLHSNFVPLNTDILMCHQVVFIYTLLITKNTLNTFLELAEHKFIERQPMVYQRKTV